jgi:hypothetical protein
MHCWYRLVLCGDIGPATMGSGTKVTSRRRSAPSKQGCERSTGPRDTLVRRAPRYIIGCRQVCFRLEKPKDLPGLIGYPCEPPREISTGLAACRYRHLSVHRLRHGGVIFSSSRHRHTSFRQRSVILASQCRGPVKRVARQSPCEDSQAAWAAEFAAGGVSATGDGVGSPTRGHWQVVWCPGVTRVSRGVGRP